MGGRGAWSSIGSNAKTFDSTSQNIVTPVTIVNEMKEMTIPDKKIYEYLLKEGTRHYPEFIDVGYNKENADILRSDITDLFLNGERDDIKINEGTEKIKFSIIGELGITKKKTFRMVWQIEKGDDKARFITAFRTKPKRRMK